MSFKFGKSYRIGKNVELNISKSGFGMSAGVPGFRVGVGPRGTRITSGIPGTGIGYQKTISSSKQSTPKQQASNPAKPKSPGLMAPKHEKDIYKALQLYFDNQHLEALKYCHPHLKKDALAGILSVLILSAQGSEQANQAISILEDMLSRDVELPSELMTKYFSYSELNINITQNVSAKLQISWLALSLFLVELYQAQGRVIDAGTMLEEIYNIVPINEVLLSLCELYAQVDYWDGVIEKARTIELADNITLEIVIFYGRALQNKKLHDGAIKVFTDALRKKKDRSENLLLEAKYWRALSYEATGKKSQAKQAFEEIYADKPNFRDVAQRLKS